MDEPLVASSPRALSRAIAPGSVASVRLARRSGLKLSSSAASVISESAATPIQRAAKTTSRMIFRKLETEPGPKARMPDELPLRGRLDPPRRGRSGQGRGGAGDPHKLKDRS